MVDGQEQVQVQVNENQQARASPSEDKRKQQNRLGFTDDALMLFLMAVAFISHAYNMFRYPIYLGDEGIYMEQAWAILRQGKLAPYTYFYDHAPAGWMMIAAWVLLLPGKFFQFGMAINSGRVLMLLIHVASVVLLYRIAKRLTGSDVAAFTSCLIFTLSPLSIYYQRMVLLDNIMLFWLLLSLHYLVHNDGRLVNMVASGLFFGLALLTKENAIFFMPVLGYMVYIEVKNTYRYRFAVTGWLFTWTAMVSIYPLYAFLKSELFPAGSTFIFSGSPGEHVSLVETWLWQVSRRESSILDPNSQFWVFFNLRWWPRDAFLVGGGLLALLANLWIGLGKGPGSRASLIAALLVLGYGFYIVRGSVMLEFYLTPLLPFMALNIGILIGGIYDGLPAQVAKPAFAIGVIALSASLVVIARDHYTLNVTQVQAAQLQWIRSNVAPTAALSIDDDLWIDLHEPSGRYPVFPNAHSHWKVQGDPEIRNNLLRNNARSLDYIILSDDLLDNLERLKRDQDIVLEGVRNARTIATFQKGDVVVQVMQVNK